jgi:hypothetical protein
MLTVALDSVIDQAHAEDFNFSDFTHSFLSFCESIWERFEGIKGKAKKRESEVMGWIGTTSNPYAKVWEFFGSLPQENLEMLDPQTLIAIAKEKYAPIHEGLWEERMTVEQVRLHMKTINELIKEEKLAAKQIEWKGEPRYLNLQIPDCNAAIAFDNNFSEIASAYREHTESADLPMPLYIEQINRLVEENKPSIIEALIPGVMPQDDPVAIAVPEVAIANPPASLTLDVIANPTASNAQYPIDRGYFMHQGVVVAPIAPIAPVTEIGAWEVELDGFHDTLLFKSSQLAPITLFGMERQDSPPDIKTCEPMSLLQIEVAGGDINEFVGLEVSVRTMDGKPKFSGTLAKFDVKNYFVRVATEEGDRICDLRETWVF